MPGGPVSMTPFGSVAPIRVNLSGFFRNSTTSDSSSLDSLQPFQAQTYSENMLKFKWRLIHSIQECNEDKNKNKHSTQGHERCDILEAYVKTKISGIFSAYYLDIIKCFDRFFRQFLSNKLLGSNRRTFVS